MSKSSKEGKVVVATSGAVAAVSSVADLTNLIIGRCSVSPSPISTSFPSPSVFNIIKKSDLNVDLNYESREVSNADGSTGKERKVSISFSHKR